MLFLLLVLLWNGDVGVLEFEDPVKGRKKDFKGRDSRWSIIRSVISVPSSHTSTHLHILPPSTHFHHPHSEKSYEAEM